MQIRLTPNVRQKFVLVQVIDESKKTLFLWGNPHVQWHKEIVQEIADAGYVVIEALGGGWILPKSDEGTVYIWGKSDRLGVAPINLVREVLKDSVIEKEPE